MKDFQLFKDQLIFISFLSIPFMLLYGCATTHQQNVETPPQSDDVERSPSLEESSEQFLKRKVAISRFSNETQYGKGVFGTDENMIGKKAMDILSAKLTSTEKFILLERSDISDVRVELERKGDTDLSNIGVSADYLIVGSISEFGRNTTSKSGPFSRTKIQTAHAGVNIRVIDVHTGEIIFSEEASAEASSEAGTFLGAGSQAGHNSALNDKAISGAISKLVSDIVENMTDKPWRSYILSNQGNYYLLAGGRSQGLEEGDEFGVFNQGEKVKNPQTGMTVQLPGEQVATIRVERFTKSANGEELSLVSVVSGEISGDDYSEYYIQDLDDDKE